MAPNPGNQSTCDHVVEICDDSEKIWFEIAEEIYNKWYE